MKFTLHPTLATILMVFNLVAPAFAGPLEDADAAMKRRDFPTAVRLIRPLAEQGDATAQYNLGIFYDNGLGVSQDKVSAYMWFNLSAAQGKAGAAAFRDLIARYMIPEQISEAQKRSREWKPTTQRPR